MKNISFEKFWENLWAVSHPKLRELDLRIFLTKWENISLILSLIIIAFFIWYYFFTKPDLKAKSRFWQFFLIPGFLVWFTESSIPFWSKLYIKKPDPSVVIDKVNIWITSLLSAGINLLVLYGILFIFFLILTQFNWNWNLRAMRRYPLKWIP